MARGKHAASAAIRRADAAHEHIDRLTDQLVEAKARARAFEGTANRVPYLEREVSRLQQQVEEGVSDQLIRERKAAADSLSAVLAARDAAIEFTAKIVRRVNQEAPDMKLFSQDDLTWLRDSNDPALTPILEAVGDLNNRAQRRWAATSRSLSTSAARHHKQDNLKTASQNEVNARTSFDFFG